MKIVLLVGICVAALFWAGCSLTRAGYKSPAYSVKARLQRGEIREYGAIVLVQTPTNPAAMGSDGSFMRLFRYISRGNVGAEKLPMTTPVLFRGGEGKREMAFVMPEGMAPASVPAPLDASVRVAQVPAGCFAATRLRGGRADVKRWQEAAEQLKAEAAQAGWLTEGDAEFASYDPPWIPRWFQRNEVLWRVRPR